MASKESSSVVSGIATTLCILCGTCFVKYLLLRLALWRRPFKEIDLAMLHKSQVEYEKNVGVPNEHKCNRSYDRIFSSFRDERIHPSNEIYRAAEWNEKRTVPRSCSEPKLGQFQFSHAIQPNRPCGLRERRRSEVLSNSTRGHSGLLSNQDRRQSWNFDMIDSGRCNPGLTSSSQVLKCDRYQPSFPGTSLEQDPIRKVKEPRHYSAPRVNYPQNSCYSASEVRRKDCTHKEVKEPYVPNIQRTSFNPEMGVRGDHFY